MNKKLGDKGLSLVEVVCAVAIFAVIVATVGGVLVFSARSYQKGSTESEIQQEAQFAANRIGGIIQNAIEVKFESGILKMIKGNVEHAVSLDGTDLKYQETVTAEDGSQTTSGAQILAGNIAAFAADVSEFEKAHTVILDMTVSKNDKNYPVRYTMNARNEEINVSTSALPPSASIYVSDSSLILVPGESYTVSVDVRGSDKPFEVSEVSAGISVSEAADHIVVTVDTAARSAEAAVKLSVKDDGAELCTKVIQIDIRSVSGITLDKNRGADSSEYTFYANVACTNAAKVAGGSNEENYKNPYAVEWSGKVLVCGSTPGNFDTEIGSFAILDEDDGTGKSKFSYSPEVAKYICIDDKYPEYENREAEKKSKRPYLKVKLTDSFDANTKLVVRATAKHPSGVNKASSAYGETSCYAEKDITVAKLKSTKILMIPGQTYTLNGVRVANPACTISVGSEIKTPDEAGIIPTFEDGNKLKIQLAREAKGDSKGVITLDIHSQGSTATQLTVEIYVRRVTPVELTGDVNKGNLKIDCGYSNTPNGKFGKGAELQLKTRIKGTKLNFADSADCINAETQAQYDEYTPYAVMFEWEMRRAGQTVSGTTGQELVTKDLGQTDASGFAWKSKYNNDYFYIHSFVVNGQSPAVNIILNKAWGNDCEFVLTARALHPNMDGLTGRNKFGYIYTENDTTFIQGTYTLKKQDAIKVAKDTIIVEPYQGETDEKAMLIPVYVVNGATVARIKVTLEGGTDPNNTIILPAADVERREGTREWKFVSMTEALPSVWNIKMKISRTEEGSRFDDGLGEKDGRIKMTIEAYDSTNMTVSDRIDTKTVYLQVRRVTEVDIEENSISNKAGETITLHARASGIEGTDYFGQQQKTNNFDPIWDKDDNYKSPFELRWTLYYKDKNGKAAEKEIGEYPEYFSNVSYDTVKEGTKAGTQMIAFTLKKPLPKGAQLRATSLHAMGRVENKGAQYNRSGLNYIRDIDKYKEQYPEGVVYDFIAIDNAIVDPDDPYEDDEINFLSGVKRGQDYFFSNDYSAEDPDNPNTQNQNYERDMNLAYQNDCHWFWRVREITSIEGKEMTFGEWTKYRKCKQDSRMDKKLNAEETRTLLPDKRYQVELALLCISKDNKTMYWPFDETVLANGTGFEGYKKGWDSNKTPTPKKEYAQTFNIGRASIAFKPGSGTKPPTGYEELVKVNIANNGVQYLDCYKTYGTFEHPLALKNGDWFEVDLTGYAIESAHFQGNMLARVQKLENNTWVEIGATSICEAIEDRKLRPLIKNIKGDAKGTYRISFKIDTYDIYHWDQNSSDPVWDPQYRASSQSQQYLICGSNGTAGYIYIKIE